MRGIKTFPYILFILMLVIPGCKKYPFDYRTKYLGNYRFLVHEIVHGPGGYNFDSTYYVDGKIDYGNDGKSILIQWPLNPPSFMPELFEDASFQGYQTTGDFYSTKKVAFTTFAKWQIFYVTGEKKK